MLSAFSLRQAWRGLWPALRRELPWRVLLPAVLAALGLSLGLTYALGWLLPSTTALRPHHALLASFAINLLCLGVLLAWLPVGKGPSPSGWQALSAWLGSVIVSAAALAGVALAPHHQESALTFIALWALFCAQAAVIAALHSLLTLLLNRAALARQILVLLVSAAVTALFWSRAVIEQAPQRDRLAEKPSALPDLADAALKLSPPMAVASAWYQESDAARAGRSSDPALAARSEGARFGLVHGPLTYKVWLGSYQASRYPRILPAWPRARGEAFDPGIALAMLLWGVPLLLAGELLNFLRMQRKP